MNTNANFIDDARQIVRDYFEQRVHYEGIMERAAAGRRSGAYTEDYERGVRIDCENAMVNLRGVARQRLAGLEQEFKDDLLKRTAPNGAELDSADFRLLSSGLPMSAAEFSALCERNASNETVLRAAGSYAAQHDMIPYFRQYYRTPTERVEAFSHIIKTARVALDAQRQYCSALDPKHWACVTGDDAKVIGPSADYYKGKTGSSSTAAPSAAGAASSTTWSAQDSTINGVV